ncbi:AAA family ATPase [Pelobacter propionicus]|uniref:AAA-superfamily of ATPases protein n=1 Tax=Pelobacter propionicus (strain DSM 2379 / NBRC 103807 / OttBd1) TaxID=338966 RepID=A1ARL7_PELPD|nr:ATP-binding protein [Pelobacter propionicus]ABK99987.1 AAA-superfamily of ATPases protein [Pelobacter propionicus DSM 2379]
MRHVMATTKNMRKFMQAVDDLLSRPMGTEGMGLLWGAPGEGKSTAVARVCDQFNGIYVRAVGCWTVTSMLGDLCRELGGDRKLRRKDMIEFIVYELKKDNCTPRPIFIDEADYCFRQFDMVDALRDIYDLSGCPVIMIGMEDIAKKIKTNARIARRITQWVEFKGLDLEDVKTVARECCEVEISSDLAIHLHKECNANIGRVIIGLTKIEKQAKTSGLTVMDCAAWGNKPLYYDQPSFSRRSKNGSGEENR